MVHRRGSLGLWRIQYLLFTCSIPKGGEGAIMPQTDNVLVGVSVLLRSEILAKLCQQAYLPAAVIPHIQFDNTLQ